MYLPFCYLLNVSKDTLVESLVINNTYGIIFLVSDDVINALEHVEGRNKCDAQIGSDLRCQM